jgi:hypothetical protein
MAWYRRAAEAPNPPPAALYKLALLLVSCPPTPPTTPGLPAF